MFPRKIDVRPAEMSVRRRLLVNGTAQIQHVDDARRTELKVFAHQFHDLFIVNPARAESIHKNGNRLCYADRIGQLDFAFIGDPCRDDVLGHIARRIGSRTVHFRRSLPENAPPPWRAMPP